MSCDARIGAHLSIPPPRIAFRLVLRQEALGFPQGNEEEDLVRRIRPDVAGVSATEEIHLVQFSCVSQKSITSFVEHVL